MIGTAVFNGLYKALNFLITPIKGWADVTQNNSITSSITFVSSLISSLNHYLPMASLLAILFLVIVIEGFYWGLKIINWVIRKIPSIN